MHAITGGRDLEAFQEGRQAAALAIVAGYEQALAALHPHDVNARSWYRARMADCRTIANLPPLPGGPLMAVDDEGPFGG